MSNCAAHVTETPCGFAMSHSAIQFLVFGGGFFENDDKETGISHWRGLTIVKVLSVC